MAVAELKKDMLNIDESTIKVSLIETGNLIFKNLRKDHKYE